MIASKYWLLKFWPSQKSGSLEVSLPLPELLPDFETSALLKHINSVLLDQSDKGLPSVLLVLLEWQLLVATASQTVSGEQGDPAPPRWKDAPRVSRGLAAMCEHPAPFTLLDPKRPRVTSVAG